MTEFAQTFLIGKIKAYLINHGRQHLADKLSPGYCAGLTVLFLYLVSQGKFELFKQLLTYLAKWSPDDDKSIVARIAVIKSNTPWQIANAKLLDYLSREPQQINLSYDKQLDAAFASGNLTKKDIDILRQAILPEDPTIEKIFGLIEWIQQHAIYDDRQFNYYADRRIVDVIHSEQGPHDFEKKIYENSLTLGYKDLVRVIESCPENRPIFLGSFDHAFALYKTGCHYYLYESNYGALPAPTTSAIAVASKLAYDTYRDRNLTQWYPLKLVITSRDDANNNLTMLGEKIAQIIQATPLNQCAFDGCSAVMLAVKNSQHEILASRIARGEDVNLPHNCGFYPIHLASDIKSLEMLLAVGANVNQPLKTTEKLLEKFTTETIMYYLSVEGATPLYILAGLGKPETLEWLIEHNADVDAASAIGLTPLMNAAKSGRLENVKMLLTRKANVSLIISKMPSPVFLADMEDHAGMLSYVAGGVKTNRYEGFNAAMLAADFQHTDIVIELLQYGADPNYHTSEGESLLTIACTQGDAKLLQELISRKVDLTKTKSIFNIGEATPLYLACRNGHKRCIELLLANGVKLETNDPNIIPPILGATLNNNREIIRVLHQKGANIDTIFQDKTPLAWAVLRGNCAAAECLLDLGAVLSKEIVDFDELIKKDSVQMLDFVMQHIRLDDKEQYALFEKAIENNALQCIKHLLNNHTLLSDEAVAKQLIQECLEEKYRPYLIFAEIIAHFLLIQNYALDFKTKTNLPNIPIQKALIIEYFDMAAQGESLDTILHRLIDRLTLANPKTENILHQAVKDSSSIEILITALTDKGENIAGWSDQNICEQFFQIVKDVIYQYPPESFAARNRLTH